MGLGRAAKQEVKCQTVVVRCVMKTCVNCLATLAHAASACTFRQCKDTQYKHNVRENNPTVPSSLRVIGALALAMPLSGPPPSDDPRSSPRTGSDIDDDNFCFACRAVSLLADEARQTSATEDAIQRIASNRPIEPAIETLQKMISDHDPLGVSVTQEHRFLSSTKAEVKTGWTAEEKCGRQAQALAADAVRWDCVKT